MVCALYGGLSRLSFTLVGLILGHYNFVIQGYYSAS